MMFCKFQETSPSLQSKNKWVLHSQTNDIEVSYRKVSDGYPLRLWRAETMIHASPEEILKRIVNERYLSIVRTSLLFIGTRYTPDLPQGNFFCFPIRLLEQTRNFFVTVV